MTRRLRVASVSFALSVAVTGCAPLPSDARNEQEVKQAGILGCDFEATEEIPVWRDRKFGWLTFDEPDPAAGTDPAEPLVFVQTGTLLRVVKAERHATYHAWPFAIMPIFYFYRPTQGPLAGQSIVANYNCPTPMSLRRKNAPAP